MKTPEDFFLESISWLRASFFNYTFYLERDVVWTLQSHLSEHIRDNGVDYRVFNDYGILPGKRRRLSSDIAIIDDGGSILVAAEFKYEPSHSRRDIPREKFPVVFWGKDGVAKDIERIRKFVSDGGVAYAYSIFIDEGGYFRSREPHPGSRWIDWGGGAWVLWAEAHGPEGK